MEWRRIRPAASHYLLHSAAQPSHLNCIQPTGFPQHTAHNVPFYVSFSKLSPPRIGANGEKVALENTMPIFVGPLSRVRPRNGILGLVVVVVLLLLLLPLRSEFIGEL